MKTQQNDKQAVIMIDAVSQTALNCPRTDPRTAPELTDFQEKPFHSFQGLTESDFCAVVGRSLITRLCVAREPWETP
jgi:hypothetical protein